MALSQAEKKEIETLVRKEIKDFLNSTTTKQFEDCQLKDLIIKSFREFYTIMYQQRSFWESKFKGM